MIYGPVSELSRYIVLGNGFMIADQYVRSAMSCSGAGDDPAKRFPPAPVLSGDTKRFMLNEYVTHADTGVFEIHRKYTDLQIMLSGVEVMKWCNPEDIPEGCVADESTDFGSFTGTARGSVLFEAGYFAVFFPGEPHAPGLVPDGMSPSPAVKVVFKLACPSVADIRKSR